MVLLSDWTFQARRICSQALGLRTCPFMSVKCSCLPQPHGLTCELLLQLQAEPAVTRPDFPTEAADSQEAADQDVESSGDLQTELAQVLKPARTVSDTSNTST